MNEIAVRRVHFHDIEPGGESPFGGLLEGIDDLTDVLAAKRTGYWISRAERLLCRPDRVPSTFPWWNHQAALPGRRGAAFATGMGELNRSGTALPVDEPNDV